MTALKTLCIKQYEMHGFLLLTHWLYLIWEPLLLEKSTSLAASAGPDSLELTLAPCHHCGSEDHWRQPISSSPGYKALPGSWSLDTSPVLCLCFHLLVSSSLGRSPNFMASTMISEQVALQVTTSSAHLDTQ